MVEDAREFRRLATLRATDVLAQHLGEGKQNSYSIKIASGFKTVHEFFRAIHS